MNFKSLSYLLFKKKKFAKICLGERCQKWHFPRWPPRPYMKSYFQDILTTKPDRNMILVSKLMFWESMNAMKCIPALFIHYKIKNQIWAPKLQIFNKIYQTHVTMIWGHLWSFETLNTITKVIIHIYTHIFVKKMANLAAILDFCSYVMDKISVEKTSLHSLTSKT